MYIYCSGGSRGGGAGGLIPWDIDFHNGFRKKCVKGCVQIKILKNPGIDFYSGFRKNVCANLNPKNLKWSSGGGGCKSKS